MPQLSERAGNDAFVPGLVEWSDRSPTHDSRLPRKNLSVKDSIAACAVFLGYTLICMCVGLAAVALVARAWLAIFE